MKRTIAFMTCAIALLAATVAWAQSLQPGKPEEVGLSSERLTKIGRVFSEDEDKSGAPPVAIISDASGVKSAVTSTRLPRGRTPIPVERRFAASSITGAARM